MDFDNVLELLNELSINKHRNNKNGNSKNVKSQQKEKLEKINKTDILCEMPYEMKDNKINFYLCKNGKCIYTNKKYIDNEWIKKYIKSEQKNINYNKNLRSFMI